MSLMTWLKIGAAAFIALVIALHFVGDHATRKDRDDYKAAAAEWKRKAEGWKASYEAQKAIRAQEQVAATNAVTEANKSCQARVDQARRSAKAIKEIVYVEPKRDAAGCPVRSLVDPDRLRDAIGAPAG